MEKLTVEEVARWLASIGLSSHVATFIEMNCDGGSLLSLEQDDLVSAGLTPMEALRVRVKRRELSSTGITTLSNRWSDHAPSHSKPFSLDSSFIVF